VIDISSNAAAVSVNYHEAPKLVSKTIVRVLTVIGSGLVQWVKLQKLAGQVLNYRTRTLSRAIVSKAPYAREQEYGGPIAAKNGTFLTIPVGPNLTPGGVMRVSPRAFIADPTSLGFEREFVNRRRTAIMGVNRGEKPQPVFALKTSVMLPERSYLRSTVDDRRQWIAQQFGQGLQDVADTLNGGGA
jgi:hypothetical protein